MFKNKILLPHQYYYPHMQLISDRCNFEIKQEFFKSLKENKELRNAMIYVHIPFCDSKCAFCGFDKEYNLDEINYYVKKVKNEIKFYASDNYIINSIHIGGGTPTILPAEALEEILNTIKENFKVLDDVEVNIEGSATTLYKDEIINFILKNKITRVSIGVQTFNSDLRKIFNTKADLDQVYKTLKTLKDNNILTFADILYGYPDFSLGKPSKKIIESDVREVIRLGVDGIDFSQVFPYSNKLESIVKEKKLQFPTSEELIDILQSCSKIMEDNGYKQKTSYGFVKHGHIIIETSYYGGKNKIPDCIAIGSGAFGFINGFKYRNSSYNAYVKFDTPSYLQLKKLTNEQLENMEIVGFPKLLSLSKSLLNEELKERFNNKLEKLKKEGLISENNKSYDLTKKGLCYVDNIYYYMLEDEEREIVDKQLKVLCLE